MIKDILAIAMLPLIFFSITILFIWLGFKLTDLLRSDEEGGWRMVISWIVYMTMAFWGLGLAITTCVVWVLFMTGNLP